jgi:membrane protein
MPKSRKFKISDLFTDKLWTMETGYLSRARRGLVRFTKLARYTLDKFAENRMGFQCVALSYFVTLAIVPMLAFIFAVSGGLGMEDKVTMFLQRALPASFTHTDILVEKAGNIIDVAKSGPVGVVSALMFMWTILWLMFQTERVFNNVWGIRKIPRNIFKRFGFYFGLMLLIPFVMIIFGYGIAFATNATSLIGLDTAEWRSFAKFLSWLTLYFMSAFTLSAMYKFIPAVKVKYKYALKAAAIDAVAFVLFQYLYLETQAFMGRLNAVYGVLAAIPLFLIWMNFSWQIIIYGAELTRAFQEVDNISIPKWESDK